MSTNYAKNLINLYREQLEKEADSFMRKVLEVALRRLEAGNNPHMVENWVVRIEKEHRSFNLNDTSVPTSTRLAIAIILFALTLFELIYYKSIMDEPYMHFLIFALGSSATLLLFNSIDRLRKGI